MKPIIFNGIHGDTGVYLHPPLDAQRVAALALGQDMIAGARTPLHAKAAQPAPLPTMPGVDANDLAQTGWGVVFPAVPEDSPAAERQAAIRAALAPLLELRRQQACGPLQRSHYYREYRGASGYQTGHSKVQFLSRLGAGPGPANPERVPYYLLLVASPAEIPFRVQYQLDIQYAVGRIHFATVEEYARYARTVVDAETDRGAIRRHVAFFGPAHRNDDATLNSSRHLVVPLANAVADSLAGASWTVHRHLGERATKARLRALLGGANTPALLFTASHGVGFDPGDSRQVTHQGALVCQDWPGPSGSGITPEHYLGAEDIADDARLRGLIAFHLACYSAGTPLGDDFPGTAQTEPRDRPAPAASPFMAALPGRLLGHPGGGALAVIGHIERAWSTSFLWQDAIRPGGLTSQFDVFEAALTGLMGGHRVGHVMESFNLRYAEIGSDLLSLLTELRPLGPLGADEPMTHDLAHRQLVHNDARNYVVIGDPAARLRIE